ncbi:MAG: sulfurtransferase [Rhizobiales bacterium]|nr:sulfurtransferase [Hyphomicrobiales bacterium]
MARAVDAQDLARQMEARPRAFALLDIREAGEAERGHIPGASALPRRLLEFRIEPLVRNRDTPVILYDDGDGRADLAAKTLERAGYGRVSTLAGGLPAWRAAGQPLATGFNVPSKAFGEQVHDEGVPSMTPAALAALAASGRPFTLWDVRTPAEYRTGTLPGAVRGAGFELILSAPGAAASGAPIVLHCAGRTRSIIATRTLHLLGFTDVTAVENGTMGWMLDGRELERGADRALPPPRVADVRAMAERAKVCAQAAGVRFVSAAEAAALAGDTARPYVFDVRGAEAFAERHAAEAMHAPAGQLVQCTDEYVAVATLPILLMDDGDARAAMAGYWLSRMGFPDVRVVEGGLAAWSAAGGATASGPRRSRPLNLDQARAGARFLDPQALRAAPDEALVLDVGTSRDFAAGHVPGALWCPRGSLELRVGRLPAERTWVLTATDERQALLAAASLAEHGHAALVLRGGNEGWRAAGGFLEAGGSPEPGFGTDLVEPPYAKGLGEMRRYLDWEQTLHRPGA